MHTRDPYIALVGKVVGVVEVLRDSPDGLPLQTLAERTGFVKSSVHRILQSLRQHGYVQQDTVGGRYRLGLKFLAVGRAVNGGLSFVQMAAPHLGRLATEFQETIYLAVLRGERGVFIDVQETHRNLRLVGSLGAEVHFHATAAGKVMAAFLPNATRTSLLARLPVPRLTPRTVTSRARVRAEWDRIRRTGVAFNREETIVGAIFVAAPIFDAREEVCGAVSVGIPKVRYTRTLGRSIAVAVKKAAAGISETLALARYVHQPADTDASRTAYDQPARRAR